jgi:hypothetical protein
MLSVMGGLADIDPYAHISTMRMLYEKDLVDSVQTRLQAK